MAKIMIKTSVEKNAVALFLYKDDWQCAIEINFYYVFI